MSLQSCYIIKIYVPAHIEELGDTVAEQREPLRTRSRFLREILQVIEASSMVGRLGNYAGLYELSQGEEWYTPQSGAHPHLGRPGRESGVSSIIITTYAVGIERKQLEAFVERIARVHPWEHPVIECFGPEGPLVWMPPA
jgi:hypothetical protein